MAGFFGFSRRAHRSPEVEALDAAITNQAQRVAAVENTARAMMQGWAAKPLKPMRTIRPQVYPGHERTWMDLPRDQLDALLQMPGMQEKLKEIRENSHINRPRERQEQGVWAATPRGAGMEYVPFPDNSQNKDRQKSTSTGPRPDNARVMVHSHPVPEDEGGFPYMPSPSDIQKVDEAGVPGLIVTDRGVFGYKMPPLW